MIVAVHQPQYLPWIGYFDKMRRADVFCYLNDVQYKKNEWQNRNRIKTAQNWQWLTVPVRYRFPEKINEVQINNTTRWNKKHLQALVTNYNRAPFFNTYISVFEDIFSKEWHLISELNIHLIERLKDALQLQEKNTIEVSYVDEIQIDPDPKSVLDCDFINGKQVNFSIRFNESSLMPLSQKIENYFLYFIQAEEFERFYLSNGTG